MPRPGTSSVALCCGIMTFIRRYCRPHTGMMLASLYFGVLAHCLSAIIICNFEQCYLLKGYYKRYIGSGAWYSCKSHCNRKLSFLWFSAGADPVNYPACFQLGSAWFCFSCSLVRELAKVGRTPLSFFPVS